MPGFSKINNILPEIARGKNLQEPMRKHRIMRLWHEAASAFVQEAKNGTQAVDYHQGTLLVACLSESLARDILVMHDRIAHALNQLLGEESVYEIKIEI